MVYGACGGPQEPGGAGDECYRDADCKAGLVCVRATSGSQRHCSNDVSSLVGMVEGPPIVEEPPADMDAAVVEDAGMPSDDAEPPLEDAEAPPEDDAMPSEDAEAPPEDAATEPDDSGT
jgi:hypothetical protein